MKYKDLDKRYRWYKVELINEWGKPQTYVFRGVTAGELRRSGAFASETESETFLLNQCVLPESDWSNGLAGVSRILLEKIYRVSGLDGTSYPFEEALHWLKTDSGALEAAAVSMISGLTLEHLESADPAARAKYLAMGKFMFETLYGVSVFEAFKSDKPAQTPVPGVQQPGVPAGNYSEESSFTWKRPK